MRACVGLRCDVQRPSALPAVHAWTVGVHGAAPSRRCGPAVGEVPLDAVAVEVSCLEIVLGVRSAAHDRDHVIEDGSGEVWDLRVAVYLVTADVACPVVSFVDRQT